MHKSFIKTIRLLPLFIVLFGCGNVKSDAKKAAKLTHKSIEQAAALKLEESEKTYKKAQKLIKKYNGHKREDKFQLFYKEHRDAEMIKRKTIKNNFKAV